MMKKKITQKMYDMAIERIEQLIKTINEQDCEHERLVDENKMLEDKIATLSGILNSISTMALVR